MAERESRRQRAQPRGPGTVAAREPAAQEAAPTNPIHALQRAVGNQAVQRLLMRRGDETDEDWARRRIRGLIVDIDKEIRETFEAVEKGVQQSDKREVLLPMVRHVKSSHQATGILTADMIATLRRAIGPVNPDRDPERYVHVYLNLQAKRATLKAEAIEALHSDDPYPWYWSFRNRSPYDVPVYHNPAD